MVATVAVAVAVVVVAAATLGMLVIVVTTPAGEEAAPGLPMVPVQKEPMGQQATLPTLSREQTLSLLQHEPASAAARVEQEL
jgi:hypothetical protein